MFWFTENTFFGSHFFSIFAQPRVVASPMAMEDPQRETIAPFCDP
jgi:hypothetical protein